MDISEERLELMNRMNISSIETFFDGLLRGKLTDNLFFNELPVKVEKGWKEMVVVDCGNPMRDKDAIAEGTVLILLYAKMPVSGVKDVRRLQEMEKTLNELILSNEDEHYHISRRGAYSNYNAVNDIFFNVIQINLLIS